MGVSQRRCAFCGAHQGLSREHVFPDGIIRKYDNTMWSLNDKSDRVFKSDLVVKDVCVSCNNGVLSSIDGKFVKLFEDSMIRPIQPGESVNFEFSYDDLLKELLKISYNSARASADGFKAVTALRKYVPYILGKVPAASGATLRLQIVTSSKQLNIETNKIEGMLEAKLLRSCKFAYSGPQHSKYMIRLLAFNSFWFYLIMQLKPVSLAKKMAFIDGFIASHNLSGIALDKGMTSISIPKEKTTYIHHSLLEGMRRK